MSSAGRAVSTNGCVSKPKGRETGLQSCVRQIRSSSLTGSYVMETAEQHEPYESRGSRTVLGEPGGESPPGHSTSAVQRLHYDMSAAGESCHASERRGGFCEGFRMPALPTCPRALGPASESLQR